MERNITSSPFRYWVTEVEALPEQDGYVSMYGRSFQDDLENVAWDAPAGNLLAIGPSGSGIFPLHLSPAHVAGRAEVIGVRGWAQAMQTPFLLTDLLDAKFIGKLEGEIINTAVATRVFSRARVGATFPVEAEDWFGLLFITQEDVQKDRERVKIMAFGTKPGAKVKSGDRLNFTEWDNEPCGELVM